MKIYVVKYTKTGVISGNLCVLYRAHDDDGLIKMMRQGWEATIIQSFGLEQFDTYHVARLKAIEIADRLDRACEKFL